ncbi:fibronectin type III domain-containing protein [Luteolibacter sp. Populi]|uniref:fibronectin type III domain-containing protein n=1 Tax=Luteolibacter sp. Populi TaxID=3230487 RepID=UPI003467CEEF
MRLFALLFLLFSAAPGFAQENPGKPTNFSAVAGSAKSVVLKWTAPAVTTEDPAPNGYYVYRVLAPSGTPERITSFNQLGANATTFTDSSAVLVAGNSYIYTVTAYIGTVETATLEGPPTDPATVTPVDSPDRPSGLRASDISPTSIRLTWNPVEGAASYILLREFEDDLEEFEIEEGTTYNDTGLTLNTTYTYTLISVSATGEESEESLPLSVTTFGDGSGKTAIWGRRFRQIDINADGQLTFGEYMAGHGGRLAWVIVKNRFDSLNTDETPTVNLAEYAKGFAGKKFRAPSKARQFYLADHSLLEEGDIPDGELDVEEYAKMRPARTNPIKIQKSFDKLNKEDTDGLTPDELKIRNYVDPDLEGQEEEEEPATP